MCFALVFFTIFDYTKRIHFLSLRIDFDFLNTLLQLILQSLP